MVDVADVADIDDVAAMLLMLLMLVMLLLMRWCGAVRVVQLPLMLLLMSGVVR